MASTLSDNHTDPCTIGYITTPNRTVIKNRSEPHGKIRNVVETELHRVHQATMPEKNRSFTFNGAIHLKRRKPCVCKGRGTVLYGQGFARFMTVYARFHVKSVPTSVVDLRTVYSYDSRNRHGSFLSAPRKGLKPGVQPRGFVRYSLARLLVFIRYLYTADKM